MIIQSIFAGLMIALAAGIYLVVEGALGAFLFSIGLLTILNCNFYLFTGKVGLLILHKIQLKELFKIWFWNLVGCVCGALVLILSGLPISEGVTAIIAARISNTWFENIALGIFCGLLMYIAVKHYEWAPFVTIMCVMGFILMGANHSIADMVYSVLAITKENAISVIVSLACTTFGNLIGGNLIPWTQKVVKKQPYKH